MNLWLLGVWVVSLSLVPCGLVVLRARPIDRLLAVNLAGTTTSLVLLLFAAGLSRPFLCDLALTVAILDLPAGLVFTHFMERWL